MVICLIFVQYCKIFPIPDSPWPSSFQIIWFVFLSEKSSVPASSTESSLGPSLNCFQIQVDEKVFVDMISCQMKPFKVRDIWKSHLHSEIPRLEITTGIKLQNSLFPHPTRAKMTSWWSSTVQLIFKSLSSQVWWTFDFRFAIATCQCDHLTVVSFRFPNNQTWWTHLPSRLADWQWFLLRTGISFWDWKFWSCTWHFS